ncbi:MAG: ATP-binding cassette domain-containing protein [Oscillospiraceae bacterium]|nr:ATP-binding cassette domain-containing protein [Oscillospiraceae bacterium]
MLEIKNLSFAVEEDGVRKEILHDLNLTIEDGRFVVITGPNGSGKSTLARLIMGIEKPTSGQILFDGQDVTALDIPSRAKLGISFAFQQPVRFKGIRVKDLLRLAAGKNLSVSQACDYLSEVGLCARDYIDREINSSLSGGELKRIEIATLLARHTRLSVFDEPEAGIDLWCFQNLIRIFEKMRREIQDSSIVIISHQERILDIADEILVLTAGLITGHGHPDEILPALMQQSGGIQAGQGFCEKLQNDDAGTARPIRWKASPAVSVADVQ